MTAPPTLGSSFPPAFIASYCEDKIKIGAVFRTFVDDTKPPKFKIYVVIGIDGDKALVGCVYVNSIINPNVNFNEYLKSLHIPLMAADHDFLHHDSFLDCSTLIEKDQDDLIAEFRTNLKVLEGEIKEPMLSQIIETVRGAKTIEKKKKEQYGIL